MRSILGFGAALAAIALGVTVPASPAAAHAELVSTEPANGAVLDTAPEQLVLNFTEQVQIGDDAVELFVSAGDQVDLGETTKSGSTITVDVPPLDGGAYVVAWRVTSADSHPVHGAFTFRVGAAASSDDEEAQALMSRLVADEGGDTTVGTAYGAVRFVGFAGMVLLIGGAAFLAVLWPPGRDDRRARRLLTGGWLAFAVATVLSIGFQGAYAAAEPLSGVVDTSLIGEVLGTRAGVVWLVRLALLAVVALAGWRLLARPGPTTTGTATTAGLGAQAADLSAAARVEPAEATDALAGADATQGAAPVTSAEASSPARFPGVATWGRDPARLAAAGVLALALLATVSLAGHAGTGRWVPLAVVLDVVHLAAISFWLGGLVLLVVAVVRARGTTGPPAAGDVGQVVAGFSTLAFAAVVLIVLTGTVQGWRQLGSVGAITDTTYGRLLVAKVALVVLMLVAAFFSRRWVQHRRTGQAESSRPEGPDGAGSHASDPGLASGDERAAVRALRRSVGVEVLVAGAVLAVAALLVNTVPGVDAAPEGAFVAEVHGTELLYEVEIDPALTGEPADVRIVTQTHDERPAEPEELTASLTLPARDLGPLPLELERTGEGRYVARDTDIPFPGTWRLEIDARISEFSQDTVSTEVPVQ